MAWVFLAGSRLPAQCLNAHALHQSSDMFAADFDADSIKLITQHTRPHERALQMQFIQTGALNPRWFEKQVWEDNKRYCD